MLVEDLVESSVIQIITNYVNNREKNCVPLVYDVLVFAFQEGSFA